MKKNSFLVILRVALAVAVWWIIFKGFTAFVEPLYADKLPEVLVMMIRSMVVPYTLGLGALYLIIKGMETGPDDGTMEATPGLIAKAFLVMIGLALPVETVVNIIFMVAGFSKGGMTADELFGSNWWFYVIQLLIFNPIFEELVFRKLALDKLLVLGEKTAIIVSSLFFALPHIYSQGVQMFFGTFIISLVWGYVRVKTGKMWPVIVLHSLFNLYGCYFALTCTKAVPSTLLYMFLSMIAIPVTAIILLVFHFKSAKNPKTEVNIC